MRAIRFGVIGCGLMGREFASAAARWLHVLDAEFKPEIVAACDTDADRRRWFLGQVVEQDGLYDDYHKLLARPDVEAVYCAVPHNLHERIYVDVIEAGKHLLGEKPFGIGAYANARIVAAAERNPDLLVRCSSEFPFWPGAKGVADAVASGRLGRIFEVRAAFNHSSDLNPDKPINWKRMVAANGEYGVLGDLGLHVLHLPLRLGWKPTTVFALLSKIITERPDGKGGRVPCETWDNATLACRTATGLPLVFDVKRIAPGEMDTWNIEVYGDRGSVKFSTKHPKTLWSLDYRPGGPQAWSATDLGYTTYARTITGEIFEFGFADAVLQMWVAYCDELGRRLEGSSLEPPFKCATLEETAIQHAVFTAALESQRTGQAVAVPEVTGVGF